jgi:pimeloyl-ACP methyl ester carboxylesterase
LRLYREIAAATPGTVRGAWAAAKHGWVALTHMFSSVRMARRVQLLERLDLQEDLRSVHVPTLVITGEADLDRVVPVARTREYATLWPHAEQVTLPRTGHLGLITTPDVFARAVWSFLDRASRRAEGRDAATMRRRIV